MALEASDSFAGDLANLSCGTAALGRALIIGGGTGSNPQVRIEGGTRTGATLELLAGAGAGAYAANILGDILLTGSNVAHGITDWALTSAYSKISIQNTTYGGLQLLGLTDHNSGYPLVIYGISGGAAPTTPAIHLSGFKKSGTGGQVLAAAEIVLDIYNYTSPLVTVLGSGNVGIGTVSPPYKLTVDSSEVNIRLRGVATRYRSDFAITSSAGLGINAYDDTGSVYLPITITGSAITLTGGNTSADALISPSIIHYLAGADANEKWWNWELTTTYLSIKCVNDAWDAGAYAMTFYRDGATCPGITVPNPTNFGIGTGDYGTSAASVFSQGIGTAPSTSPANIAQMWVEDIDGAGTAGFKIRTEDGLLCTLGRGTVHTVPATDHTANGDIITITVDTNAEGFGAPLFMAADGNMDTADADGSTTAPCVALALETGTGSKKVLLRGVIRDNSWNWTLGPGRAGLIFLSTTVGTLMQTSDFSEFGTDDVLQVVGFAITADSMFFNPQYDYVTKV